ncbi:MAG: DUF3565 domain-containing protein [Gammaproteobacteria bacterium]|nr:DUF3565 domain-containing protein [Gammaproteobacteria bacterium]
MRQKIVSFDKDEVGDWVAVLSCGHTRHVRHNPPWFNRPWVEPAKSREEFLGTELNCKKCEKLDL